MSDKLTRAITKDGFFKISAVVSTETAETARKIPQLLACGNGGSRKAVIGRAFDGRRAERGQGKAHLANQR